MTPTISIIVPVHNGGSRFAGCLASLAAASPRPEEIIVVADGESDGSWRLAESMGLQVVRRTTAGGPAKARNAGAREASGEILFFVDADVTIRQDAVGRVGGLFQKDPYLAAAIGSYDDAPGESNFLSQYRNLLHHFVHQSANPEGSTFWGACGAIRRDVFLKIGGFDESYDSPCIEDIELGYRLKMAGFRIALEKSLQVKHFKRWSVCSMLKTDLFDRAIPWTVLILNSRGFINDLNVKTSSRLSVLALYFLLLTLLGTVFLPWLMLFSVLPLLLLVGLNWDVYRFFTKKRGVGFALKAIPWHWFYFLCCGLGFVIGFASWKITRPSKVYRL